MILCIILKMITCDNFMFYTFSHLLLRQKRKCCLHANLSPAPQSPPGKIYGHQSRFANTFLETKRKSKNLNPLTVMPLPFSFLKLSYMHLYVCFSNHVKWCRAQLGNHIMVEARPWNHIIVESSTRESYKWLRARSS